MTNTQTEEKPVLKRIRWELSGKEVPKDVLEAGDRLVLLVHREDYEIITEATVLRLPGAEKVLGRVLHSIKDEDPELAEQVETLLNDFWPKPEPEKPFDT